MDLKLIKQLIHLVETSAISSLKVQEGELSIEINKEIAPILTSVSIPDTKQILPSTRTQEQIQVEEPIRKEEKVARNERIVKAPIVGTFYRASSPDAEPYVKEGYPIAKGQTMCIIEAMKVMNEIESEFTGIVKSILIENATPVEYGQDLFIIEV